MAVISVGSGGSSGSSSSSVSTGSLNSLISLLMGQVRAGSGDAAARAGAIDSEQQTQADYTKANAFADSQELMNNRINQILQDQMPSLTLASEGAGASASSMRALLLGKLMNQAASDAAALGAQQAVSYGQISNQAGSVLEQLTASDPAALNALIEAMKVKANIDSQNLQFKNNNSKTTTVSNSNNAGIKSVKNTSGTPTLSGVASFGPSTAQQSTSNFFNRPGGVLDNSRGGMVSYGPAANYDPGAILQKLQNGLTPVQQMNGIPGASNIYDTGTKF